MANWSSSIQGYAALSRQPVTAAKSADKVDAEALGSLKQEIYNTIQKMYVHPSQSTTQTCLNISDEAFERMLADPNLKNELLGMIQKELAKAYSSGNEPAYTCISIDKNAKYASYTLDSGYGKLYAAQSKNSFWNKEVKASALLSQNNSDPYSQLTSPYFWEMSSFKNKSSNYYQGSAQAQMILGQKQYENTTTSFERSKFTF